VSETGNWVRVAAVSDVIEGSALPVEVGELNLAIYHLAGGQGQGDPIEADLKTFPIRVEGDDLLVRLPA